MSLELPELPSFTSSTPPNMQQGAGILARIYRHTNNALQSDAHDLFQIKFHGSTVINEAIPLMLAIEGVVEGHKDLLHWLTEVAELFGVLIKQLSEAEEMAKTGADTSNIHMVAPVTIVKSGKCGRPKKIPNPFLLRKAMDSSCRISKSELARTIKLSWESLLKYMKKFSIESRYSSITDKGLDNIAREVRGSQPETGHWYLAGHLSSAGIKVQKERIRQALICVDPIGQAIRNKETAEDHMYCVPRPNAMWHIDRHHKLIRWGFVIHGIIDGFCRTVVGLQASTNNRASTVLKDMRLFGMIQHGVYKDGPDEDSDDEYPPSDFEDESRGELEIETDGTFLESEESGWEDDEYEIEEAHSSRYNCKPVKAP
uniref:Integrase core domain-containing protein n=1 Tax=Moniliophthora roreri TaxID=221103 RepID=A0A0W0G1F3_MONRR